MFIDPRSYLRDVRLFAFRTSDCKNYGFIIPHIEVFTYQNHAEGSPIYVSTKKQEDDQHRKFKLSILGLLDESLRDNIGSEVKYKAKMYRLYNLDSFTLRDDDNLCFDEAMSITLNAGNLLKNKNVDIDISVNYNISQNLLIVQLDEPLDEGSEAYQSMINLMKFSALINICVISNILHLIATHAENSKVMSRASNLLEVFKGNLSDELFDYDNNFRDEISTLTRRFNFEEFDMIQEDYLDDQELVLEIAKKYMEEKAGSFEGYDPYLKSAMLALRITSIALQGFQYSVSDIAEACIVKENGNFADEIMNIISESEDYTKDKINVVPARKSKKTCVAKETPCYEHGSVAIDIMNMIVEEDM